MTARRLLALAAMALPTIAGAQRPVKRVVPEGRLDAFAGGSPGAQVAGGVAADLGGAVRLALLGGVGGERRPGGAVIGVQRVEGVARFHVDPFRQTRHGLYFGGGVGVVHTAGSPLRPLLVAVVGVEGAPRGGVATAIEAGVGGGARVGLALRGARRDRR